MAAIRIEDWSAWKVVEDVRRALRKITPTSGYNTRPTVPDRFVMPDQAAESELPMLVLQIVGLDTTDQGFDPQSFTDDEDLGFIVWAYVRDDHDITKAALAVTVDVLSALWDDESRGDNAVLTNLEGVDYDFGLLHDQNVAIIALRFVVSLQTERG